MNDPRDSKDHAETQVLDRDNDDPESELDPAATAVLGEDYRRRIESESS